MSADAAGVQLLVDLSELVRTDARSGIQRATRGVLAALLNDPPPGVRVTPVYDAGGFYAHAPLPDAAGCMKALPAGEEQPIRVAAGDIFFGLDLAPEQIPRNAAALASLKAHGVRLYFVVYDLLPALRPEWFFKGAQAWFTRWLEQVAQLADGLICNAEATADQLLAWLEQQPPARPDPLYVGCARLGADLGSAYPLYGLAEADQRVLDAVRQRPTFLMVGTLEPRKMHTEAVQACDLLWRDGLDVNLVIVGKPGWNTQALAERLHRHPEAGTRLLWSERASDELLVALYHEATALLAASAGEGFGLPLIEAAHYDLPVIARDLPVFREVGGEHAWYFGGTGAPALAQALSDWLALHGAGQAPRSGAMPRLTWEQSAREFLHCMDGHWYAQAVTRLACK